MRVVVLTALMGAVGLAVAVFANWRGGQDEVLAAGLAAGVCLLAGYGALVIASLFTRPDVAVLGVLGGMMFRMAIPLGVCFALIQKGSWLVERGLPGYMVVFYLVGLLVETVMVVPALNAGQAVRSGSISHRPPVSHPASKGTSAPR